jgi:hypothetical protein
MDKEAARLANLARQRRWHKRHKQEITRSTWARNALKPTAAHTVINSDLYKVFALSDPRDDRPYPRYIGIARFNEEEPWQHLWRVREYSLARWALWLRQLEAADLSPVSHIVLGSTLPIRWPMAVQAARLEMRSQRSMGKVPTWAFWPRLSFGSMCVPIGCVTPTGRAVHFRYGETWLDTRRYNSYAHLAEMCRGHLWFED